MRLSKIDHGPPTVLARFDLSTASIQSRPNEWNLIRIEAIGPRIRVWCNRTHGDPDKGLRIDYTDTKDPILSGAVGVTSWKTTALFDDLVVLPTKP